ncbi:MAG: hypothetical protein UHG68_08810 [Clostridia bacterium]|nr:hypothetical protein [Clostridia bacterium]
MSRFIDAEVFAERLLNAWTTADEEKRAEIVAILANIVTPILVGTPTADVAPRAEVFEEVDKFRADLMNKFIDLCRGNDYNKLTLLKIGDVVDEIYDRLVVELKKKYAEGKDDT